MASFPRELLSLITYLKKFPGVGRKTAERFAFHLLSWSPEELQKLSSLLGSIKEKIKYCSLCGCLEESHEKGSSCPFCFSPHRDPTLLCIVASARDVYPFEETKAFQGLYHVLGGLLSPLYGKGPSTLSLASLEMRFEKEPIAEVIMAFDSTLEGDATALFLKEHFDAKGIKTTRLAFGLPMGSSLDFIDYGTLERALLGRRSF